MQQQDAQYTAQHATQEQFIQSFREQRLITLALGDQVAEARWAAPELPGGRTLHDALARLLAWNEWAIADFELSLLRALPPRLVLPASSEDEALAFEERAEARSAALSKNDLLGGLQVASTMLISAAVGRNNPDWFGRRLEDLAGSPLFGGITQANSTSQDQGAPTVGDVLRWLLERERTLDAQISESLGVSVNLADLKKRLTNS